MAARTDPLHDCLTCGFAVWDRTESGRLHSSKRGQCAFTLGEPALPQWAFALRRVLAGMAKGRGQTLWRDATYAECETWKAKEDKPK